ncbi:unnamed protein product [Bursaphelenchus okinawaensis]|uniref:Uncharacterized protein n=1 Tax=Bursaphelenchus okinawaensis TaxID=465554 RepID=A0A811KL41_9BILA|nr:unnamed protein product [Bursaphelenchus okinawaensis]CAG9105661.1 unnamed protein product [Bursaphelenchus okinawaensis]
MKIKSERWSVSYNFLATTGRFLVSLRKYDSKRICRRPPSRVPSTRAASSIWPKPPTVALNVNHKVVNVYNIIPILNCPNNCCNKDEFHDFLERYGIIARKVKIDYKPACRIVYSQIPPRKKETAAQKRTQTLMRNLLYRPDDEYLSAFYFYAAIGFMFYKDKFQPLTAKQFYSAYYIVGESDPEGEQ